MLGGREWWCVVEEERGRKDKLGCCGGLGGGVCGGGWMGGCCRGDGGGLGGGGLMVGEGGEGGRR